MIWADVLPVLGVVGSMIGGIIINMLRLRRGAVVEAARKHFTEGVRIAEDADQQHRNWMHGNLTGLYGNYIPVNPETNQPLDLKTVHDAVVDPGDVDRECSYCTINIRAWLEAEQDWQDEKKKQLEYQEREQRYITLRKKREYDERKRRVGEQKSRYQVELEADAAECGLLARQRQHNLAVGSPLQGQYESRSAYVEAALNVMGFTSDMMRNMTQQAMFENIIVPPPVDHCDMCDAIGTVDGSAVRYIRSAYCVH